MTALNDNRIDIIATDHAPHTMEEKMNHTQSLGWPNGPTRFVCVVGMSLQGNFNRKIVEKMAHNPKNYLISIEEDLFARNILLI